MSLRALRKLQESKKPESSEVIPENENVNENKGDESDEELNSDHGFSLKPTNRFDLLIGGSPSESEVKEDDDLTEFGEDGVKSNATGFEGSLTANTPSNITGARKKKKKKKKRGFSHKLPASSEDHLDNDLDEVEKSVREVNAILGEAKVQIPTATKESSEEAAKYILFVEHKHLNPQNEMKRIFGSWVVQANETNSRRRNQRSGGSSRVNRGTWIAAGHPHWAHHPKPGITMSLVESHSGYTLFKFQHLPSYQQAEFKFLEAVDSINPENILGLLNNEPFHVNTLLQVSEIFRLADDAAMAAQLIERAIYVLEASAHPLFNLTTGACRLQYKQQENRSFFISIFRHILNVGQKGCYRTALELCKLLLNLSPEDDPLAVSLMLDFYAIRSQEYAWLISLYDLYEPSKNLSMLPNFSFSVPLALFHLSEASLANKEKLEKSKPYYYYYSLSTDILRTRADKMLQRALVMFPGVLKPLLDKCGIQPDPEVDKHFFFGNSAQTSMNKGLSQIVGLFVGRNYHLWKEAGVMGWLESNVRKVLEKVDDDDPMVTEAESKRNSRYRGTPTAIYRHILMAEINDATATLPPSLASSPVMSYDPLPPPDTKCDYSRPKTDSAPKQSSSSILASFFRSILPSYVPGTDPQVDQQHQAAANALRDAAEGDAVEEEGAVAAIGEAAEANEAAGVGGELRASVNTLLEAMRDLLSNIRIPEHPEDADHSEEEEEDADRNDEWG